MHKKVKDGVGYQLTAEGTRPEVLPPLSWKSPESSGYFYISDFQQGCTRVHLCPAKSTTKAGRYENTKMAKKNQVLKKNLLLAGLFLADHSNLLVQVLPPWTSVTQRLLVLLVNKGHQVFPSLAR